MRKMKKCTMNEGGCDTLLKPYSIAIRKCKKMKLETYKKGEEL